MCIIYLRAAPTAADPLFEGRSFVVLRLGDGEAWKLGGSADLRFGCLEPRRLGGFGGLKLPNISLNGVLGRAMGYQERY